MAPSRMPSLQMVQRAGRCWLLGLALSLWTIQPGIAQMDAVTVEHQVKAAFLYKFGGYVEWPAAVFSAPDSPFIIGVLGPDAFCSLLAQTVEGRSLNGRVVKVHCLHKEGSATSSHIVFIARAERAKLAQIMAALKGLSVLTVTEIAEADGQWPEGSMINFVLVDNRVRFDVAPAQAERQGLRISARLMSVAHKVVGRAS